jgi:hypothetical protein
MNAVKLRVELQPPVYHCLNVGRNQRMLVKNWSISTVAGQNQRLLVNINGCWSKSTVAGQNGFGLAQ